MAIRSLPPDIAIAKAYQGNTLTMLTAPAAAPLPAATPAAAAPLAQATAAPAAITSPTTAVVPPAAVSSAKTKHHHKRPAIFSDVMIPLAFRERR